MLGACIKNGLCAHANEVTASGKTCPKGKECPHGHTCLFCGKPTEGAGATCTAVKCPKKNLANL